MNKKDNSHIKTAHTFHIPIMGTGFTIDTPLKVARYGISSVISLVDDVLIEQMRKIYCKKEGEPYEEIKCSDHDARASRITAYLNLVDKLVKRQVKDLQASPFEKNSEITRYYEMLPDDSSLKNKYQKMLDTEEPEARSKLQEELRNQAVPGRIDVNIMTKLDAVNFKEGEQLDSEFNDGMAALRGFAESSLQSAIVFSAGINAQIYTYIAQFKDFFYDKKDNFKKTIILKVSDYRSALTQGKFLAKKGLWVSEYRIESGLNCGGHTFPAKGFLMGPILDEFKKQRNDLIDKINTVYTKARKTLNLFPVENMHNLAITMQGGIGTSQEDAMIRSCFDIDATGWGTPFLLAPDVICMDDESLTKVINATEDDSFLSDSSPIGVPFWNLKNSASEDARRKRIADGVPGASCPKGFLALFNKEFTERPICLGSAAYQRLKLKHIEEEDLSDEQKAFVKKDVLAKSCICDDLGGVATITHGINKDATPAICSGPNIAYFSKQTNLTEMIDHIYGRISLITHSDRPHMFIEELKIYIEHLNNEVEKLRLELSNHTPVYLNEFKENLLKGIEYYKETAKELIGEQHERFISDLNALYLQIENIVPVTVAE